MSAMMCEYIHVYIDSNLVPLALEADVLLSRPPVPDTRVMLTASRTTAERGTWTLRELNSSSPL
jgi:hypothetical protein